MSTVSTIASCAGTRRAELPTSRKPACAELVHHDADEHHVLQPEGNDSPTGIRSPPPDTCRYIAGYEQLSKLGVGFYPIRLNKSPAVKGKLDRQATSDLMKITSWVERGHRNFALRILKGSRLMVVDTECPFKHPGKLGPDGELILYGILEEHGITLPPCPTVQTATGGFHRYFLVPRWLPVRSAIGIWPGIDILAAGSSVILTGSRTDDGQYRALRSFKDCPIREAPKAFIALIREAQKTMPLDRPLMSPSRPVPAGDSSLVSTRQWYRLFHNRVFYAFWNRKGKLRDNSDSAYEYHLAKACFCCGLDQKQAVTVVQAWRDKHGLRRSRGRLRNVIIPGAWREVSRWVDGWRAQQAAADEARKANKTASKILAFIRSAKAAQTPSSIATALGIPRERAKKAMQRLADNARLLRTTEGYILPDDVVVTH
jgi:hypothetical protein